MRLRISPRTSGVHHACIAVHRACPSLPHTPCVCDTHTRGPNGPCVCHMGAGRTSGLPRRFLAYPGKEHAARTGGEAAASLAPGVLSQYREAA
jgi:hypothetical protein